MQEQQFLNDIVRVPCPSCGSQLTYSAGTQNLRCAHCGYQEMINNANDLVVEKSLSDAADKIVNFIPEKVGKKVFDCQNCGSKFMVEHDRVRVNCGFCGSTNVNLEAYQHNYIHPVGIIPFYISRDEAETRFSEWIRKGWFHPGKLKNLAKIDMLHGIYIPFWTYDAKTFSEWQGEAGFYYYETRTVRINGKMQTQQIRKTRWVYRSGDLNHFFDDVLVVASAGLSQNEINPIQPYRFEELVNFDARLMLGWESEIYQLEVDKGYQIADTIMDDRIRNMCSAQLGGDTQRNLKVHSRKSDQTFKHIILPLWICSYQYNNKNYRFLINGQTGKVAGTKPISWIKIAILVLLFAIFIAGIVWLKKSGIIQS
ncbi:MAG: hypothetical protein KDC34_13010 [Saprospiraceae bacterium]|nr:hypothetical protein [Saprospiraceae bacterium]